MPKIYLDTADSQRGFDIVAVANGLGALALGTRVSATDIGSPSWTIKASVNGAYDATSISAPTEIDSTNQKGAWRVTLPAALCSSTTKSKGDKIMVYVDCVGTNETIIGREIEVELDELTVETSSSSGGASNRNALIINARWKKGESVSSKRGILISAYDVNGEPADPRIRFDGTNELLVDPSTGARVAPGGTLANVTRPLTVADFNFTTTHATDVVNATAHGRSTGDGPFQLTTTGTLPAGYNLATNYWWIWRSANTGQLASSLANALAGTAVAITSDGSGTHTISDVIGATRELVDGQWRYTASQAEINISGSYFGVTLARDDSSGAATGVTNTAGTSVLAGSGFDSRFVGRTITVAGFANGGNNGSFVITAAAIDGTTVTYANPSGVTETLAATWSVDDGVPEVTVTAELYEETMEQDAGLGGPTWGDIFRGDTAVLTGTATGFQSGTITWVCPHTGKTRWTHTIVPDGRSGATKGDLT